MAGACTRQNPGFGGSSDDPSAASSTSSDQGEVAEDTSKPDTTGPDQTSGGTTHVDDTTTTSVSETGEGTTGEPVCMQHESHRIEIEVHDGAGAVITPNCGAAVETEVGYITVTGNSISHQVCPGCTCMEEGQARILNFGDSLSPPAELSECGTLAFWAAPEPNEAGACEWQGFAVFDQEDTVPMYVGSNSRSLPQGIFGMVQVGLADEALCVDDPAGCLPPPGRHGLTFANDVPVFVGNPQEVIIAFAAALPFLVTNRMASVTPECREHVSWTALVQP